MYAIIETGGKQYKAEEGKIIEVEKLNDKEGKEVTFDKVLLISDKGKTSVGTPYLEGKTVNGTIKEHKKTEKVTVFKMKPKKRYKRTQGHKQNYSVVEITSIK
ncbi:50S ribosomal protein L21 [Candidatus Peregrinibacteria bacterium]|nr:50S ribosomal protein L21 [Candidatus Peregrinibacteria bacterium]